MTSGGGSYSSIPDTQIQCDRLIFVGVLQSPDPSVVSKLKKGDKLIVEAETDQGPVIAKHATFGIAGSIVEKIPDMLRCIEAGYEYEATITEVRGVQVTVEVRPK